MPEALLEQAREEIVVPELPAPFQDALTAGPYNFEFTGEDRLRLTVHNALAGVEAAVAWRMKRKRDGVVVANETRFTPSSDRLASTLPVALPDGYLLNAVAYASAGSPRRGQTFIRLRVVRGTGGETPLGTLIQGYVTGQQDRAWPGSPLEGSLEGDGYVRHIVGTNPAAGTEARETVPTGARWQLATWRVSLSTSGAAGTRAVRMVHLAAGVESLIYPAFSGHAPSTELAYQYATGMATDRATNDAQRLAGFPDRLQLLAGATIGTDTSGIDAGDNYTAPIFTIQEWLEPN